MSDFISIMAERSRARADELLKRVSRRELRARALAVMEPAKSVRSGDGFVFIAEFKRASPSEGVIVSPRSGAFADAEAFAADQARAYERGGASVISVLTEPSAFGGDLKHAQAAARAVSIPVMRKDFLVDPAQVDEARLAGCSGVLLIVRMLRDAELESMLHAVLDLGMFTLIEAFDDDELQRTAALLTRADVARRLSAFANTGASASARASVMVGLNTRNLATLGVNPASLTGMASRFPAGFVRVAESGMHTPTDLSRAAAEGYTGALVGTALMRSTEPDRLVKSMRAGAIGSADEGDARIEADAFSPLVKICGVTTAQMVADAVDAGADAVGCVLAPSPRQVTPARAAEILRDCPLSVSRVAVMKNPTETLVREALATGVFDCLQCEQSDVAMVRACVESMSGSAGAGEAAVRVIPVVRVGGAMPTLAADVRDSDLILIEGQRSGVGEVANWGAIAPVASSRRVILAGGLNPENVVEAIRAVRPFAVDVSSGVESAPGVKDVKKVRAFVRAVKRVGRREKDSA